MGCMLSYGSAFPDDQNAPVTATGGIFADFPVSPLGGSAVFPAVFYRPMNRAPTTTTASGMFLVAGRSVVRRAQPLRDALSWGPMQWAIEGASIGRRAAFQPVSSACGRAQTLK